MKEQLNFYQDLPLNIRNELNEIYPRSTSDMQFFLQNTEPYHDLFQWHLEKIHEKQTFKNTLYIKYKISSKDAKILKNTLKKNTKIIFLKNPINAKGGSYRQIHLSKNTLKPGQPRIYVRPLKIYLSK
tara:strand:+ start:434 stop:817 length:384 start_codon:yes stop_codon:yes gene_type:complete